MPDQNYSALNILRNYEFLKTLIDCMCYFYFRIYIYLNISIVIFSR